MSVSLVYKSIDSLLLFSETVTSRSELFNSQFYGWVELIQILEELIELFLLICPKTKNRQKHIKIVTIKMG